MSNNLMSIWKKRELIFHSALMNVKMRYKGTNLGFLWNVLEPLLTFVILYVVFTSIRDRPDDFGIYLLTGIMLYHVFTRGTMSGIGSLRSNRNIIRIGNGIFPVISIVSITLTTAVEMAVFLALLPILGFVTSWTIIFFPLVIILMLFLVLGLTLLLSIINVYVRDIQPVWAIVIHALFFVSPIFWYVSNVNELLVDILKINPIGQIIELGHQVVVFGNIPPITDWLYTLAFVAGIFFVGLAIFRKFEIRAVEEF